jgi:hypothetical protein
VGIKDRASRAAPVGRSALLNPSFWGSQGRYSDLKTPIDAQLGAIVGKRRPYRRNPTIATVPSSPDGGAPWVPVVGQRHDQHAGSQLVLQDIATLDSWRRRNVCQEQRQHPCQPRPGSCHGYKGMETFSIGASASAHHPTCDEYDRRGEQEGHKDPASYAGRATWEVDELAIPAGIAAPIDPRRRALLIGEERGQERRAGDQKTKAHCGCSDRSIVRSIRSGIRSPTRITPPIFDLRPLHPTSRRACLNAVCSS